MPTDSPDAMTDLSNFSRETGVSAGVMSYGKSSDWHKNHVFFASQTDDEVIWKKIDIFATGLRWEFCSKYALV